MIGVRLNREIVETHQSQAEQVIANLAALRAIASSDKVIEQVLANPPGPGAPA